MRVKMGLHRNSGRADALFREYVATVKPNVVKFLDPSGSDDDLAAWCRAQGTEVIGRVYFQEQPLGAGGGRAIATVLTEALTYPNVKFWELYNETHQAGEDLARYAALSIDFMKRLDALDGRKGVIGCFSVGMPDLIEEDHGAAWRLFAPALRYAAENGHYLGLHQYGGGSQGMKYAPLWYALRHRLVVAWAKRHGIPMPRILITESGIDHLERADLSTRGWQTMPSGYDYAADMAWFCQELSADPLVAGVVDFGWAPIDRQWKPFDLSDSPEVLGKLASKLIADAPKSPAQTPPSMAKVVWAIQEARRILEREGLRAESVFVGEHYEADAIRRKGKT